MGYVNSVHFSAWHIPCYDGPNCDESVKVDTIEEEVDNTNMPDYARAGNSITEIIMTANVNDR